MRLRLPVKLVFCFSVLSIAKLCLCKIKCLQLLFKPFTTCSLPSEQREHFLFGFRILRVICQTYTQSPLKNLLRFLPLWLNTPLSSSMLIFFSKRHKSAHFYFSQILIIPIVRLSLQPVFAGFNWVQLVSPVGMSQIGLVKFLSTCPLFISLSISIPLCCY